MLDFLQCFLEYKLSLIPTNQNVFVDFNDVAQKPKMELMGAEVQDCNIGTKENPNIVNISKSLPPEEEHKYIDLLKEHFDVFTWGYKDLKAYDTNSIQHTIPIKEDKKPFKQKLRRVNHVMLPLIQREVRKIFYAKINVPLIFSKWVSNLVTVTKKTREIRLCVDFCNINKCSLKDNYPLPKKDNIL